MNAFWLPEATISTPHSSVFSGSVPAAVMQSAIRIASVFAPPSRCPARSHAVAVEVSL